MTIQQLFELALEHHHAGRLAEAEGLYRQILTAEPSHAEALHFLGIVAQQVGKNDVAVELIRRAVALKPSYAEAHGNLGNALRQLGQSDEAVAAYRQAIALNPNDPDAYNNLGVGLYDIGQVDEAIAAYRQAIALNSDLAEAYNNLGLALKARGQLDEAIAACRQAIALKPNYPDAYNNLGHSLYGKGQVDEAIAICREAIALRPGDPEAHYNLGICLYAKDQLDEAIAACRQAIALNPNYAEAYSNLGVAVYEKGQLSEAIALFRRAIALKPNYPEAHNNLGNALKDQKQFDEAIAACRRAIVLKPDYAGARNTLGVVLYDKGELDEAIATCREAIALEPDYAEAHSNLGVALKDKGLLDEAVAAFRQAIALGFTKAHWNLGLALLVQGEFHTGWQEYEWRCKIKHRDFPGRNFTPPQWDGGPLEGRTLLLHGEQGFGDAIHFIRYVPLVRQRGGNIIIECEPQLRRLFQRMAPDLPVVVKGEALPAFDVHSPLLSLPRIFATDLSNIPRTVPYLQADAAEAAIWRERLAGAGSCLKAGLVWAGSPANSNDRNRSLQLASFAPLAKVSGVRFYSLQKGGAASEVKHPPPGMELVDVAGELKDFADTAALIANLDLVISVDTAVVHLAGAMGKPVWTLLPFAPDWRWLLERTDSPWYPTVRLFRQPKIGDWDTVIAEVCEELRRMKDEG